MPVDDDGLIADEYLATPAIMIEINSPSDDPVAVNERARWCLDHGVRAVAVVDPDTFTATVMRTDRPTLVLSRHDWLDLTDIFPSLRLSLADLFAELHVG